MTSLNLIYFLRSYISKYSYIGALTYEFCGHKHLAHNKHVVSSNEENGEHYRNSSSKKKKKKKGGVQLGLGLVEESGFEPVASLLSTYVTMDKLFNLFDP